MPKASVSNESVHFDLKSLEGGWVEIKRLNYGQKLARADMAMKMSIEGEGAAPTRGMSQQQKTQAIIESSARAVALFEFQHCVVDHNLFEDEAETQKLNFASPDILNKLDPRVGDEVGQYIDELNNFDPEGN